MISMLRRLKSTKDIENKEAILKGRCKEHNYIFGKKHHMRGNKGGERAKYIMLDSSNLHVTM
jgi:hypothetical protein